MERVDIHIYFHSGDTSDAAPAWAKPLIDSLTSLTTGQAHMSQELDDLTAQVTASTTVQESAMTLLTGLKTALDAAIAAGGGTPPAALVALSASLSAESAKLAAAITANTPAAGPTPASPSGR
jgi:hypothetical protein